MYIILSINSQINEYSFSNIFSDFFLINLHINIDNFTLEFILMQTLTCYMSQRSMVTILIKFNLTYCFHLYLQCFRNDQVKFESQALPNRVTGLIILCQLYVNKVHALFLLTKFIMYL